MVLNGYLLFVGMDRKAVAVLESYGWEQGKGLGKKESGMVESIKVARKSNTKGVSGLYVS